MKSIKVPSTACAILLLAASYAPGVKAGELLLNGGFESSTAALATGNNIGTVPSNWTMGSGYPASDSNQQNGASTSGSGSTLVTLQPYSGTYSANTSSGVDTTGGGTNCWDGTGTTNHAPVTLTQTFTLSVASNLAGSFAIGGRDFGSETVSSTVSFSGTTSAGGTYTSPTQTGNTTNSVWTVQKFNLANVPAGTYTYSIVLADFQNIDAVSLVSTAVPEPSTWAMLLGGMGLLGVVQRVRRAGRI